MRKTAVVLAVSSVLALAALPASGDLIRGGAVLSPVSSVVKISRVGNNLDSLVKGEILYLFTEDGTPVSQIVVRDVFSDEIFSEPLPDAVARQIRETNAILIFSNLREYGDFIRAYLDGTREAFEEFISRHPRSELVPEAQRIIDGIIYRPFKLKGTVEALEEFIGRYPGNYYAPAAARRRDDLVFAPYREEDRVSGYRSFIVSHPRNIHVEEARRRIEEILAGYEEAAVEDLARYPRSHKGRRVRFQCLMHSALPVYLEGPGTVGRRTASFRSPRDISEFLNFQVQEGSYVLWRLFVRRSDSRLVEEVRTLKKGDLIRIYGEVFDVEGGAPWIDVRDMEVL